jgi:hypothetical protein
MDTRYNDLVSVDCEVVSAESKPDDDIVGDLLSKEYDTDDSEIEDEPIEENVPRGSLRGFHHHFHNLNHCSPAFRHYQT